MAATSTHPEDLSTRGVRVLARFLPLHEEHAPLGFGLPPHTALAQIADHLGDAARLAVDPESPPLTVAVPLTWAAATAVGAIPRLSPEDQGPAARAKDELLEQIDRAIREHPGAHTESATDLVSGVTAELGPAFAVVALLERDRMLASDGLFPEEPLCETETAEQIGSALFELAVSAVAAVERLETLAASDQSSQ